MTHPPLAKSTILHIPPMMFNCQNTLSLILQPADTNPKMYGNEH